MTEMTTATMTTRNRQQAIPLSFFSGFPQANRERLRFAPSAQEGKSLAD
jgi:hypothetical protein